MFFREYSFRRFIFREFARASEVFFNLVSKISGTNMIDVSYRQSGDQRKRIRSLCFFFVLSKGKNEKIWVAICDPRSSSALIERPHTACRLRNLADFIFSTTTTTTTASVDDAGLDDSSRTHISQGVRSCGNFDILEYGAMRERGEILRIPPQKLHHFDSR